MKSVVAIIGRPNVGKSRLFNRIIGQRISIVADMPGVTRDRIYATTTWNGKTFDLMDTAGLDNTKQEINFEMQEQVNTAIDLADLVLFVVDYKIGVMREDIEVANILRKNGKEVLVVINKCDKFIKDDPHILSFYELGFDILGVSAENGIGIGDLLDKVVESLPEYEEEQEDRIKVALIGQPNVGKSSLINKIMGENRNIVTDIPGTTRDSIDVNLENKDGKYLFIDTAGLRKKSKIIEDIEKYSIIRTNYAIERSDVCIVLIDATKGVQKQDTKILGLAHELGKAIIILVNKWDLIEDKEKQYDEYYKNVRQSLAYAQYAPIIFVSAKTGQRIDKIFKEINKVYESNTKKISTSVLNKVVFDAIATNQPPSDKGKKLKIYYVQQIGIQPPTFLLFVNSKELFHFSYQRYIINQFRNRFDFTGTPIKLIIKEKKDEK